MTVAGGPLGGDFSYVKPVGNATIYRTLNRKSHVAINVEGGLVRPYDGKEIPIFERFRIGGDRSVRAFAVREHLSRSTTTTRRSSTSRERSSEATSTSSSTWRRSTTSPGR